MGTTCYVCQKETNVSMKSTELFVMFGYYFCCEECLMKYIEYIEENK